MGRVLGAYCAAGPARRCSRRAGAGRAAPPPRETRSAWRRRGDSAVAALRHGAFDVAVDATAEGRGRPRPRLAADPRLPPGDPLHPPRRRRDHRPRRARAGRDLRRRRRSPGSARTCWTPTRRASSPTSTRRARPTSAASRPAFAENAALAAGLLADHRRRVPGAAHAAGPPADRRRLRRDGRGRGTRRLARLPATRDAALADLDGFTAAPFTPEEQSRRAHQLTRFLDLIPVEYDRGTADGEVTLAFEIQEAVAFSEGAQSAFSDLESTLQERDPAGVRDRPGGARRARPDQRTRPTRAARSPRRTRSRPSTTSASDALDDDVPGGVEGVQHRGRLRPGRRSAWTRWRPPSAPASASRPSRRASAPTRSSSSARSACSARSTRS